MQRELEKRKIQVLADEAARNATPDDSSEEEQKVGNNNDEEDEQPGNDREIDEKRFMRSMARQEKQE